MKLLFSEARPDYDHYIFPYAVWAFPDPGETPADFFAAGFLPSSRQLDRFYLCRQIRVDLSRYRPSSENRRILRRAELFQAALLPRHQFEWTPAVRDLCRTCADARFGPGRMSEARLEELFHCPMTSHILEVRLRENSQIVGVATLYLEHPRAAYYSYAFYDLAWRRAQIGMFMMTTAVDQLARTGLRYLHLGTCYSQNALYKTQFAGVQFFNGFRWSDNLHELRHLLERDRRPVLEQHLLESPEFQERFLSQPLPQLAHLHGFRVTPAPDPPGTNPAQKAPAH